MITPDKKLIIAKIIREETGCGIHDAGLYFDKLVEAIKHRPLLVMDNPYKLKISWGYEKE